MGTWGTGNFENDHAYDWLNTFFRNPVREEIKEVFDFVLDQRAYLSNQVCQAALVAAELVALRLGRPSVDLPEDIVQDEEIAFAVDDTLTHTAERVVNKIWHFTGDSEARELWQDAGTDAYEEWGKVLLGLLRRLQG